MVCVGSGRVSTFTSSGLLGVSGQDFWPALKCKTFKSNVLLVLEQSDPIGRRGIF